MEHKCYGSPANWTPASAPRSRLQPPQNLAAQAMSAMKQNFAAEIAEKHLGQLGEEEADGLAETKKTAEQAKRQVAEEAKRKAAEEGI